MPANLLKILSHRLSNWMEIIAGSALIIVMLLSVWDIVGRAFGHPIPGTYEIVSFAGGLVIGLSVPITSLVKEHVCVDLLILRLSHRARTLFIIMTKLMGTATFLLAGCGMIMMGMRLNASGEVTAALGLPFYPVAYAISAAFFVEALILLSQIAEAGAELKTSTLRKTRNE